MSIPYNFSPLLLAYGLFRCPQPSPTECGVTRRARYSIRCRNPRDSAFFERDRAVSALSEMHGRYDEAVTQNIVLPEGLTSTRTSLYQPSARITFDSAAITSVERTTQPDRRTINDGIRRSYRGLKLDFLTFSRVYST